MDAIHGMSAERLLEQVAWLKRLVRSLVADEALVEDVAQDTLLAAMQAPRSVSALRPWLARVAQRIASRARYRDSRRRAIEALAARPEAEASAADVVERVQIQHRVVAALLKLSEPYRTTVLLRYFEDLPPRRIAARMAVPVETVRTRLRRGLARLRQELDRDCGGRRAWLLPLLGAPTASAAATIGVLAMTTKTKVMAAVAAVLMLAGIWVVGWGRIAHDPVSPSDPAPAVAEAGQAARGTTEPIGEPAATTRREVAASQPSTYTSTGSLRIRVRYADEPRPASDVLVILNRPGGDFRVDVLRGRTDVAGTIRFEDLPTGSWEAATGLAHAPQLVTIHAGKETECNLDLQRGMVLRGIVVDETGTPIAGAQIEVASPWRRDAEVMATAGADGTFELRGCPNPILVGARAAGYASSSLHPRLSFDGTPLHVRLELVARGGIVDGLVVAADGTPVADAVVRIGKGRTDALMAISPASPPLPAQVRTDREGRFRACGVAAGTQPVQVRAVGFAPFSGRCEVTASAIVPIRVALPAGASCTGSVVSAEGAPVGGVTVRVGTNGDFVQLFARTASDGSFTLRDLPTGAVELQVADTEHGAGKALITTVAGATAPCELRLSKGQELHGRVVDESDQPVGGLDVQVTAVGNEGPRSENVRTNGEGRFHVRSLPVNRLVDIRVLGKMFDPVRVTDVDPAAGEVLLRVVNAPRSAFIRGVVLGVDGRPTSSAHVVVHWQQSIGDTHMVTQIDGSFELGPLRSGDWRLYIVEQGCAQYRSPTLQLDENELVDLGKLQLHRGGTLGVSIDGAPMDQLALVIYDDRDELVAGILPTLVPLRSMPLNPGGYTLRVRGKGFAAQSVPFTIRNGEETKLQVSVAPGISQHFVFRVPQGQEAPAWFAFDVLRDGSAVLTGTSSSQQHFAAEHWLAPGEYEVAVRACGLHGSARFTVGDAPGPPVVVPIR